MKIRARGTQSRDQKWAWQVRIFLRAKRAILLHPPFKISRSATATVINAKVYMRAISCLLTSSVYNHFLLQLIMSALSIHSAYQSNHHCTVDWIRVFSTGQKTDNWKKLGQHCEWQVCLYYTIFPLLSVFYIPPSELELSFLWRWILCLSISQLWISS